MILKQLLFGTLLFAGLGFASCGSDTEDGTTTEQSDSTAATGALDTSAATQIQDTFASSSAAPAQPVAAGMNPAHGEPGHRCDISVGAPLSTPKAEAGGAQPQIQMQEAPATTQPTAGGSGKVNPAHGQPGHDCKVAVGAPLP